MKKTKRIWFIIASCLILIGCITFAVVMTMLEWDFKKLSTVKFKTTEYEISEMFNNISIQADTADIKFALSGNGMCKVECFERERETYSVNVQEDTLVIDLVDNKSWYDYIGINFESPKITVYLPKEEYMSLVINDSTGDVQLPENLKFNDVDISLSTGDVDFSSLVSGLVSIKTSTGDVSIKNISAGDLDLSTSTGEIYLSNIRCQNLKLKVDTGDISIKNAISEGKLFINASTGDVSLLESDASDIFIETSTGNVTGSLLTDKIFITHSDTGRVNVPEDADGGECKVYTDTGNIQITVE